MFHEKYDVTCSKTENVSIVVECGKFDSFGESKYPQKEDKITFRYRYPRYFVVKKHEVPRNVQKVRNYKPLFLF